MYIGDYTLEELEDAIADGAITVRCSVCGDERLIELDGCFHCSCGRCIESPLLVAGMI